MTEDAARPPLTEANWSVLGLLRFLLAFSVMVSHSNNVVGFRAWLDAFPRFSAVEAFFMISGFSIASSYTARPQGFLLRRVLRVYPLSVVVACLATLALFLAGGRVTTAVGDVAAMPGAGSFASVLLLANGLVYPTPFLLHPFWSLSCEMLYYCAAFLLLRAPTALLAALLAASGVVHLLPLLHILSDRYAEANFGHSHFALLWAWLLGVLAFRFAGNQLFCVFAAVVCNLVLAQPGRDGNFLGCIAYGAVAICVCNLEQLRFPSWLGARANYLGDISYPLYLVHFPVLLLLGAYLRARVPALVIPGCWLAALLLAMALYHAVDRPLRRLRRGALRSAIPMRPA